LTDNQPARITWLSPKPTSKENSVSSKEPTIRLTQEESIEPRISRIPLKCSRRWAPVGDDSNQPELTVSVFLTQHAYIRLCAHAGRDLKNEVGGWMVGKWCMDKQSGKQFVIIETILPAEFTQQGSAFLTFTQDSQVVLHETMSAHYPDKVLVGWYHTHPRMGVFFSAWDTWLHNNFFPEAWQVALVIEPFSAAGGFFIRQVNGLLDSRRYFGFYELASKSKKSVVHWRNMVSDSEISKLQEEDRQ
jgi:proteasome lid subunit RPN8/RPN11